MTSNVPAWKRLGLKLKYAKDEPQAVTPPQANKSLAGNDRMNRSDIAERPAKRQRLVKDKHPLAKSNGHVNGPSHEYSAGPARSVALKHGTLIRKKSVTFAGDTKVEDGDPRISINLRAGSAGSAGSAASTPRKASEVNQSITSLEVSSPMAGEAAATGSSHSRETKQKQQGQSGKKSKHKHQDSKGKKALALEYLAKHRSDRSSWKFNKNREIWILTHALDVDAIPTDHVLALADYVRGLPKNAGARQRLVKDCKEAFGKVEEKEHVDIGKKEAFLSCLSDQSISEGETGEGFLGAHSRPVILLWALDEAVAGTNDDALREQVVQHAATVDQRKKKKSRTAVPVDVSSSESDSNSSSESDSENQTVGGVKVIAKGQSTASDETSSSGSDSDSDSSSSSHESSSDSDSD